MLTWIPDRHRVCSSSPHHLMQTASSMPTQVLLWNTSCHSHSLDTISVFTSSFDSCVLLVVQVRWEYVMVVDLESLSCVLGVPMWAQTRTDTYEHREWVTRSKPYAQNKENSFAYAFVGIRDRKECPLQCSFLSPMSVSAMNKGRLPPVSPETPGHCFGSSTRSSVFGGPEVRANAPLNLTCWQPLEKQQPLQRCQCSMLSSGRRKRGPQCFLHQGHGQGTTRADEW